MDIHHTEILIDDYIVHFYCLLVDRDLITEAKYKGRPLISQYSYRKDQPHYSKGQYHLHIYLKSKKLFAINKDGTAHDNSHGVRIPNKVASAIKTIFPDFKVPNNNIIESCESLLSGILVEYAASLPNE